MNPTIESMLKEEYKRTLQEVSAAQAGSDDAKWKLQKLTELHKQLMEETQAGHKCFIESHKLDLEEREAKLKEKQAEEGKVWTCIKVVLDGVAVVLPIAASWIWMARGLRFEQTGTFTSRTGQWLDNHRRLFKK